MLCKKGLKAADIAFVVLSSTRVVRKWMAGFNERGVSSLFPGYTNNENAGKLTRAQKDEIKQILSQAPSEYGLPLAFWSLPQLKEYIGGRFGIVYESERFYHYLLQWSGFS